MFNYGEFTFQVVTDKAMLEAMHRLRYRMYVEEYGYEKPEDHPGGLERDELDDRSIHLAATDRRGRMVGTMRLVMNSPAGLPTLHYASPEGRAKLSHSPRLVEVSRFVLDKDFHGVMGEEIKCLDFYLRRFRARERTLPSALEPEVDPGQKRLVVFLGLIELQAHVNLSLGVTHVLMMTDRRLWVLLKRNNLPFEALGPEVDHHGRRASYMIPMDTVVESTLGPKGFRNKLREMGRAADAPPPSVQLRKVADEEVFSMAGHRFSVANTEDLLHQVFRLRYEAMVKDFGLTELPHDRRAQTQQDPHDAASLHLIALGPGGKLKGTLRLTLNSGWGLPCLEAAGQEDKATQTDFRKAAELSRFSLAEPHRGAARDLSAFLTSAPIKTSTGSIPFGARRRANMVSLGLFRLAYRVSKKLRLTRWYFSAGPTTVELFHRLGIPVHRVGPSVESLGFRGPVSVRFQEVEPAMLRFQRIRDLGLAISSRPHSNK